MISGCGGGGKSGGWNAGNRALGLGSAKSNCYEGLTRGGQADDNKGVKRGESPSSSSSVARPARESRISRVPAATLTLSVLLCIGALADGQAAAAVVAQNLGRHGTTASERETVASLLSSLNDAARKICQYHQPGPAGGIGGTAAGDGLFSDALTAFRSFGDVDRSGALPGMLEQDLNLPPPVALF